MPHISPHTLPRVIHIPNLHLVIHPSRQNQMPMLREKPNRRNPLCMPTPRMHQSLRYITMIIRRLRILWRRNPRPSLIILLLFPMKRTLVRNRLSLILNPVSLLPFLFRVLFRILLLFLTQFLLQPFFLPRPWTLPILPQPRIRSRIRHLLGIHRTVRLLIQSLPVQSFHLILKLPLLLLMLWNIINRNAVVPVQTIHITNVIKPSGSRGIGSITVFIKSIILFIKHKRFN
ncbi:hypothetical protein HanRHA438_Chr17g0804561 [Helianthus annuus]|nr:hypothetical protein HanRHA438_Chr17g0804561 [Helianthus annuus]